MQMFGLSQQTPVFMHIFRATRRPRFVGYFKNADFYFTYSISTIGADIIEMIGADLKTVFRAVTDMLFANADGV